MNGIEDDLPILNQGDLPGPAILLTLAVAWLLLLAGFGYLIYHLVRFALGGGQ